MLQSYTTRPQRYPSEIGHIFVTDKEYEEMKDDICAFTEFDGHKYWATNSQINECDVYVIDPDGIDYFKELYKGNKIPYSIELKTSKKVRKKRMLSRGDSRKDVRRRLKHDKKKFAGFTGDHIINGDLSVAEVVNQIAFIMYVENHLIEKQEEMSNE